MCVHMPACVPTARFTLTRERDFAYMLHVVFARVQHALGCMCVHMSACIRRNMLHCVCVCVCPCACRSSKSASRTAAQCSLRPPAPGVGPISAVADLVSSLCVVCICVCACVRERERACVYVRVPCSWVLHHTHAHTQRYRGGPGTQGTEIPGRVCVDLMIAT
jgi:hypothetical protein